MLGTSTVTTKSTSRRISSASTSRAQPGSDASDSGSVAGGGETHLDLLAAPVQHQRQGQPAPIVSASGWTWAITAMLSAAESSSAAPTRRRAPPDIASAQSSAW
ncbi:hypothetical protein I551_8616 [Mycobacterium ulcerans str. Harvey]|uniref:Uncharacterized protein n=1 Tax=Mycobacterium ulcerans str. Harvey TaxID=1299332 RepID=A0ABN0RAB6_MYCUL|nr:hypothetical protein I551_8616 [Mycobacterium ulcerans str. Harvey]